MSSQFSYECTTPPIQVNLLINPHALPSHTHVRTWTVTLHSDLLLPGFSVFTSTPALQMAFIINITHVINHTVSSSTQGASNSSLLAFWCFGVLYAGRPTSVVLILHLSSHLLKTDLAMPACVSGRGFPDSWAVS